MLSRAAGRQLEVDAQTHEAELDGADRNLAIAHMLRSLEILPDDPRDVVDGIMRLNGLTSSALDVGQSLAIPREFATPAGAASGD